MCVQGSSWRVRGVAVLLDVVGICFSARHGVFGWFSPRTETAGLLALVLGVEAYSFKRTREWEACSRHRYAANLRSRVAPAGAS